MSNLLEKINTAEKINLGSVSHYVTDKIDVSELSLDDYISTENMLSERGGITQANKLPNDGKVIKFKKGDTLTSNIRPYFKKIWQATKVGGCSNDVLVIRTNNPKELDENFLYYNISNDVFFAYSMMSSQGTKMPRGDKDAIIKYEIFFPDLPTQKKIAGILSAYDAKIENNNLIIKKLEATAQTLFDEWFVNFRYPGYEKAKFIDSEMGEIPEGWEVKKLGDLIDVSGGFSYKGEYLSDIKSETLLVTMGNISPNDRFNFNSVRYYNGEFPPKFLLKPGDIALATRDVTQDRAILGAPLAIPELLKNKNVLLATNMYAVKNLSDIDNIFFFHLFRSDSYRERMVTSAKGSNILMLTKDTILDFKFILSARIYIDEYLKVAKNIKITIESCVEENISLKSQRDLLLAKLI